MMKSLGHEVHHYGTEGAVTLADEEITVFSAEEREKYFKATDKDLTDIHFQEEEEYWQLFNNRTIDGIKKRIQPGNFICVISGTHKPIGDAFSDHKTIEFGVGYTGCFSKYKVFESYALMHYFYGDQAQLKKKTEYGNYFDCVIPNYYDPSEFPFSRVKDDYFLFVGRLVHTKGLVYAVETAARLGKKIKVAGQGALEHRPGYIRTSEFELANDNIEYVGVLGPKERGELMSKAQALFVPTQYIGPFEGVSVEAAFCGTPIITTDWGSFAENNIDGVTGYRTRSMGEMVWAAQNVGKLDPSVIRKYAVDNFSMERVKYQYQAYFEQLQEDFFSDSYNPTYNRYKKYVPN